MKSSMLNIKNKITWLLPIAVILVIASCKKEGYLGFTPGTGAPTVSSVHTYYKTDTTATYDTIVTYNGAGQPVQTIQQNPSKIVAFDSVVEAVALGNLYQIQGTNLGSATSITFNGYTAYFNRALITDNSIIVQIPSKTPYYGPAATDSMVITTTHGSVAYKLAVLPPPPTVSDYSNFNFSAASPEITIDGIGFASVTSVSLSGTQGGSGDISIVSQNDSVMVLQFASTSVSRGVLNFMYSAAGQTDSAKGKQELINLDAAYPVFVNGNIAPGWGSWSWDNAQLSNAYTKTSPNSWNAQFSGGGWKIDGFRNGGGGAGDGLAYSPDYTYLVFWVYGGSAKETIYIEWGNEGFANGGGNQINGQVVLPGQWNYFKIPISSLLWNTGTTNWAANSSDNLNTVAFFMNSNSVTEQLYFDDIVLVK